jgi:hypothetical protein
MAGFSLLQASDQSVISNYQSPVYFRKLQNKENIRLYQTTLETFQV